MSVSTSLPDRAAERAQTQARARRRARLRVAGVALALVAVVAGLGWLLFGSPVFAVERVQVIGLQRLSEVQVLEQAAVHAGTPLARVDTDAVARRVRELAPVRAVEVSRDWPSAIRIAVREREPAAVRATGGSWSLVDRSGVAFATVDRRPAELPVISAPVDQGAAALRATLDVLDVLPLEVRADVRQVRAASPESVTLRLTRDRTVVWGSLERSERKAAVLRVLLSRKASVYDVSAPNTPTTRR